jgi:hypothetical protein
MEKVPMKSDEYNELWCRMPSNEGGTLARWEVEVDPIPGRDKTVGNRISWSVFRLIDRDDAAIRRH